VTALIPPAKAFPMKIRRYFIHSPQAGFPLRAIFFDASLPGVARSASLVYWSRTGINLGPELLSVIPVAERIKVPALLISGDKDWIVPTEKARRLFSAIPGNRKQFLVIPGAVHDTSYAAAPALYADTVLSFLNRYI
jgi:pimeloyl-ACP methyl ester carboxylesterase